MHWGEIGTWSFSLWRSIHQQCLFLIVCKSPDWKGCTPCPIAAASESSAPRNPTCWNKHSIIVEKVVVSISVLNEPVSPTCSLRKFLMSPFCAKKEHNSITNTNSTTMFMITKLFSEEKKDSKYVSCNNKTLKDVKQTLCWFPARKEGLREAPW